MKIISRPSRSLTAEKAFFNETRRQVEMIQNTKDLSHDNIVGGINWGTALLRTQIISQAIFDQPTSGAVYSITSPREKPQEKQVYKNYEIQYRGFSIEHISGYRDSKPEDVVSELWLKIDATPTAPTLSVFGAKEYCMLNRSRLRYEYRSGYSGMLFQLSPYGSPQLYTFNDKKEYENMVLFIEETANLLQRLALTEGEVSAETTKIIYGSTFR